MPTILDAIIQAAPEYFEARQLKELMDQRKQDRIDARTRADREEQERITEEQIADLKALRENLLDPNHVNADPVQAEADRQLLLSEAERLKRPDLKLYALPKDNRDADTALKLGTLARQDPALAEWVGKKLLGGRYEEFIKDLPGAGQRSTGDGQQSGNAPPPIEPTAEDLARAQSSGRLQGIPSPGQGQVTLNDILGLLGGGNGAASGLVAPRQPAPVPEAAKPYTRYANEPQAVEPAGSPLDVFRATTEADKSLKELEDTIMRAKGMTRPKAEQIWYEQVGYQKPPPARFAALPDEIEAKPENTTPLRTERQQLLGDIKEAYAYGKSDWDTRPMRARLWGIDKELGYVTGTEMPQGYARMPHQTVSQQDRELAAREKQEFSEAMRTAAANRSAIHAAAGASNAAKTDTNLRRWYDQAEKLADEKLNLLEQLDKILVPKTDMKQVDESKLPQAQKTRIAAIRARLQELPRQSEILRTKIRAAEGTPQIPPINPPAAPRAPFKNPYKRQSTLNEVWKYVDSIRGEPADKIMTKVKHKFAGHNMDVLMNATVERLRRMGKR